jgi:YbgC/YbaW family acyl-CoA thioester hydrolase
LPYDQIVERGLHALTLEAKLRNHSPAHVDDLLLVHAWVSDIDRVRFTFAYEIRRDDDNVLVASGETVHICVGGARGRPEAVPDWLRAGLNELREAQSNTSSTESI